LRLFTDSGREEREERGIKGEREGGGEGGEGGEERNVVYYIGWVVDRYIKQQQTDNNTMQETPRWADLGSQPR
jgi:hypothetical protein